MLKHDAVASLGELALVQPTRLREALRANDRLKLALTVLQAAAAQAAAPERPPVDLAHEIAAAGVDDRDEARWWRELPSHAVRADDGLHLTGFETLVRHLAADLTTMARPLLDSGETALAPRITAWQQRLATLAGEKIDDALIAELTRGRREAGDSLHLLVMDLHKALNRLAATLQGETIAGAHVWGLAADGADRARVEAFARGVERTRAAKLDHPGLETSATRDGERLLIQNDIGTNDAHVLVLHVEPPLLTLTYSDLHRTRFEFFQRLQGELGATWSDVGTRTTAGLNRGDAYRVGTAQWRCADEAELLSRLEAIGSHIVFLIDWNRARKRLAPFVGKADAIAVLHEAARREVGHVAWLAAGGERLVWTAMAAQDEGSFRLGDRLEDVLGPEAARDWLVDLMVLAADAHRRDQPLAYVADEAALLLGRRLRGRALGVDLLQEHAAWCHALAQGLRDGLAHGVESDPQAAARLAARAKGWERQADEIVVQARTRAERRPAAAAEAELLHTADDVADALEEACFVLSLVAEGKREPWGGAVREALQALADAVLAAVQEHVKAVAIVAGGAADAGEAIDVLWRVVQAERHCDELLRGARRALAREARDAVALTLGNELAASLEEASDLLLVVGYSLRRRTLAAVHGAAS
jgi:uncharacterized protein Yka (UPF0111/DUF47 family)